MANHKRNCSRRKYWFPTENEMDFLDDDYGPSSDLRQLFGSAASKSRPWSDDGFVD